LIFERSFLRMEKWMAASLRDARGKDDTHTYPPDMLSKLDPGTATYSTTPPTSLPVLLV
jgi:hypothetical protein